MKSGFSLLLRALPLLRRFLRVCQQGRNALIGAAVSITVAGAGLKPAPTLH